MVFGFLLIGSIFGFASAIASFLVFGTGLLTALAVWSVVGIAIMSLGITFSMLPRRREAQAQINTPRTI